jgi:hypothetical protein
MSPDKCARCRSEARWLVLDELRHTYLELYLTRDLKVELKPYFRRDVYLLCESCKRQTERYNRYKPPRKPRVLKFFRWS